MTLNELSDRLGHPPRMIRYLISEGILPPATKGGGRAADAYTDEHLRAGDRFNTLHASGLGVRAIAAALEAERAIVLRECGMELKVVDENAFASASDEDVAAFARSIKKAVAGRRKSTHLKQGD